MTHPKKEIKTKNKKVKRMKKKKDYLMDFVKENGFKLSDKAIKTGFVAIFKGYKWDDRPIFTGKLPLKKKK